MKIVVLTLPLFAICAVTISAQQTTHHTSTTTTHRRTATPCPVENPLPPLPPAIPPASGTVESAFALRYIDIKPGDGAEAQPGQFYTVHYTGWLASDGTKFDSSLDRSEPITFQQGVRGVIPGWDYGFAGMHVGGKRRLFIPYQLAYGQRGRPPLRHRRGAGDHPDGRQARTRRGLRQHGLAVLRACVRDLQVRAGAERLGDHVAGFADQEADLIRV